MGDGRLSRRALLGSGLALAACATHRAPAHPHPARIHLGWRWVPGSELRYRCRLARRSGDRVQSRSEHWSYVVSDLDLTDIATLEGHLTGLGVAPAEGHTLERTVREESALLAEPVRLRMGMDGRVVACSQPAFSRSLPHRMLGVRLPVHAVNPQDAWADPDLVRRFARLLPASLELEVEGSALLRELFSDDGQPLAAIETRGSAAAPAGPRLLLEGMTVWNTRTGALHRRTVAARFEPAGSAGAPGQLHLELTRT